MERETHKPHDGDRAETAKAPAKEEPVRDEGGADGVTGVSQTAYDKAKNDAVKDVHG